MERIALVLEETGESIPCLLNPESIVMRRQSGVRSRVGAGGLGGANLSDDPLHFVGGGWTEFELDLLFDTELQGTSVAPGAPAELGQQPIAPTAKDVRNLTKALWDLSESTTRLPNDSVAKNKAKILRLVWGQAWNVPGVVLSVAERLERFSPTGHPSRSWLRLRIRRVEERVTLAQDSTADFDDIVWPAPDSDISESRVEVRDPAGAPSLEGSTGESRILARPDLWSQEMYGTPFLWRLFAYFSDLDNPLLPTTNTAVRFPPREAIDRGDDQSAGR